MERERRLTLGTPKRMALANLRSESSSSLRPSGKRQERALEKSFDEEDSSNSSPMLVSDAQYVQQLMGVQEDPQEKALLEALHARLVSEDAETRAQASREVHAIRTLGLHGAKGKHVTLAQRGRTASDTRLNRDMATGGGAGVAGSGVKRDETSSSRREESSPAVARKGLGRRLSFFGKKKSVAEVESQEPVAWGEDWRIQCDSLGVEEWREEEGQQDKGKLMLLQSKKLAGCWGGVCGTMVDALLLEDAESYRMLYETYFVGRPHALYLGRGPRGPVVVAVETMHANERKGQRDKFRVLLLDKNGYRKGVITSSVSTRERLKHVKRLFVEEMDGVTLRKPEKQQQLSTQMMIFERKRIVHHAKFGLLYRKAKQHEENDVFSNEHGSPQFVTFLSTVADIIALKGHAGFRGGLDVKEDLTGPTSAYTRMAYAADGSPVGLESPLAQTVFEIMLHVAPLLPFDKLNPQQLHKKRHVGNDIVVIIFCEGDDQFSPEVLTSNYNHVFLLVRPVPDDPSGRKRPTHYQIAHASVRGVKPFRPYLPKEGLIPASELRAWLLTKCLNGERAAMYAPEFSQKLSRTIQTVVGSWVDEYQ